jgi:arylsulfatase
MKTTKLITVVALVALAFMASHATAQGQTTGAAGTPLVLPRPDYHFSGNVGRTYLDRIGNCIFQIPELTVV